jgi:hypothetical protein
MIGTLPYYFSLEFKKFKKVKKRKMNKFLINHEILLGLCCLNIKNHDPQILIIELNSNKINK